MDKQTTSNYATSTRSFFCFRFWRLSILFLGTVCGAYLNGDNFEPREPNSVLQFIQQIGVNYYGGWDSHYYSEGRDNLDGGSLITNDVQLNWKFITGELWYVASPGQSYDELQAILALSQSINNLSFYATYTHLQFPSDNLNDDEVGAGISLSGLPANLQLAVDAYYSFVADGSFAELSAAQSFAITESLSVTGTGIFGINQNYISDGHDGANHVALRLESMYMISESIALMAQITQSWEIDRDKTLPGDDPLVDLFYGSIGIQWSL